MFKAVITERGKEWLEEERDSLTRAALALLVSPPLEATDPRALYDMFCGRVRVCQDAQLSIDECRLLWRNLRGACAIALRQGNEPYREPLGYLESVVIVSSPAVCTVRPGISGGDGTTMR